MVKISFKDYLLEIPKGIYLPSEDTYLFLDTLKKESFNKRSSFLEMGPGSGILSLSLYGFFENLCLCDIDLKVVNYLEDLKKKYSLNKMTIIQSNLFSNLKNKKFDVIIFNPPYVPSEKIEVFSTDGGKKGSEIIFNFLENIKFYLKKKGVCYLLVSSHNDLKKIYNIILKNHLTYNILSEKKLFFEKLLILKICEK